MSNNDYPEIEPDAFDIIIVGTGLEEAIVAAAAASAGHSVLHLDANPFYGSQFASLSLQDFFAWASSSGKFPQSIEVPSPSPLKSSNLELHKPGLRSLYSDFEIKDFGFDVLEKYGTSRDFNLDLAGPKVSFCAGTLVDLLLRSGGHNHVEFKSIERSYVWFDGKGLVPVPDSRASIFQDRTLSLVEKRHLMKFFKLVQSHGSGGSVEISLDDLESPFFKFLDRQQLPSFIKSIILYAIALVDHDQEDGSQDANSIMKTKHGIESLILYFSSLGRFVNASGAFLYPVYGQAELPQVFCRAAAVQGSLYVLRMPVTGVLIDKENGSYKGIQIASGQYLFSQKLFVNPSVKLPESLCSSVTDKTMIDGTSEELKDYGPVPTEHADSVEPKEKLYTSNIAPKVAWKLLRAVCLSNQSLKPEFKTLLVIFPPRSVISRHRTVIRALQLDSSTSVCPKGMYVVYISTLCLDLAQGKEALNATLNSLFVLSSGRNEPDTESGVPEKSNEASRPNLLWCTLFSQDLKDSNNLATDIKQSCVPDETLDYRRLVNHTNMVLRLFLCIMY
eukprot:TRINITY_DN6473_c0_g1_i1.p1 TRINITY_DN6473_c0_g1~~TRINITY_DN6473_c0_g1_i1.p1  ORF type:complete len:560 (-),score=86.61 TRINITY_DN6473_c0_g1_i1:557-2236(-)